MNELVIPNSYHIFHFPFLVKGKINKFHWEKMVFDPKKSIENYNQHSYFYDFAENTLFNMEKSIVEAYLYTKLTKDSIYSIQVLNDVQPYDLHIDHITLKEFTDFGVGVLSFHLANFNYSAEEDILKINEYGRRIYPQFLDRANLVLGTKNVFLANRITLNNLLVPDIQEDFQEFDRLPLKETYLPKHITELIGENIKEVLDDRMFVCCLYGNPDKMNELKIWESENYSFIQNDFWYSFLFVDKKDPTCQSKTLRSKLVSEATNDRWIDYGTLYGVSRYSFVLLLGNKPQDFFFGKLLDDLKLFYSQMAILCLVQRATLLKFSAEITNISNDGIESKEVSGLYKRYIRFRNQLYFREVTAQEQGIELYDLLQKQMRLEKEVKDLDEEIAELNSYIQTEEQGGLTKVATYFLPASFIAAILAFVSDKAYFQFDEISLTPMNGYFNVTPRYVLLFSGVCLGFVIGYLFSNPKKLKNLWKK